MTSKILSEFEISDDSDVMRTPHRYHSLIPLAGLLGGVILAADLLAPVQGAVAVLYVTVVLLVARAGMRRWTAISGIACVVLAGMAFLATHGQDSFGGATVRLAVSLVAIAVTTLLSMANASAKNALGEQARILDLGHDAVIVLDASDRILHWSGAAERLYGWTSEQALGANCHRLLRTEYSSSLATEHPTTDGQWSGDIVRYHRDGRRIFLTSSRFPRLDPTGREQGIVETSSDVTATHEAQLNAQHLEHRCAAIFHSAGVAIWEADWSRALELLRQAIPADADPANYLAAHPALVLASGKLARLQNVNDAAARLFDVDDAQDLMGANLVSYFTASAEATLQRVLAGLLNGTKMIEEETRFITRSGRFVDVILRVTNSETDESWSRILIMALDVTERNENQAKLAQMSEELAHAARVSTLGQLAASIAHEVNQPLTAILTSSKSAKRWMSRPAPDLAEVTACLEQIGDSATRAADVVSRIRSLASKRPREIQTIDLPGTVEEAVSLVNHTLRDAAITLRTMVEPGLALVSADRIQVQQVLVNLIMNAIQAMEGAGGRPGEIMINATKSSSDMIRVDVVDNGSGIAGDDPERIFEPFFSTKRDGMGMGMAICRTIIEAQGGKISAANNPHIGATVSILLPKARSLTLRRACQES